MRIFAKVHSRPGAMAASNGATRHVEVLSRGGHGSLASSVSPLTEGVRVIVPRADGGIWLGSTEDEMKRAYGMKLVSPQMPFGAIGSMFRMTVPTGTAMRFFVGDDGLIQQINTGRVPYVDWNDACG